MELGLCVPGPCGEGFRGADFGFTLLLPASPLPMPQWQYQTGTQLETEGKGGGRCSPYKSASWDTGQGEGYRVRGDLGGQMN